MTRIAPRTREIAWALCLAWFGTSALSQPVIVTQPKSQKIGEGATATLSVEATGTPPLSYQWQTSPNGTAFADIPGATGVTLEVEGAPPLFQWFRVEVSNAEGVVFSNRVRLTMITLPIITTQPASLTVASGETITLRVRATSNGRQHYQWRFEGEDLPGEIRRNLTLADVQPTDTGEYTVVVSNDAGTVESEPAHVKIGPAIFTRVTTGPGAGEGGDRPGAWADYDNDGYVDLFVRHSQGGSLLYRNNGDGTFTSVSDGALVGTSGGGTAVWGDYDNDGNIDIYLTLNESGSALLYRNLGDGNFERVKERVVSSGGGSSRGCAWADYDCDGDLDLFRAIVNRDPDMLFENNGDGTFTRITEGPVVSDSGWSYGASWLDYDNDGAPDLFVTDYDGSSLFYINHGNGSFTFANHRDTGLLVGTISPGLAWGDYDNDGDSDCFVPNHGGQATIGYENFLFRNNGDGSFTRVTDPVLSEDSGQSSAAQWADYDNDGWLDLFLANGGWFGADLEEDNVLYHNNGDGTFSKVTGYRIAHDYGRSRGCSWADYDNDGFLDLFVSNFQPESDILYRNSGNGNAWLILKLEGTASNRSAIGATIRLKALVGGEDLWQTRVIFGGDGYTGQNDLRVHFGLADAARADLIQIEWPSGIVQELTDVEARQILNVTETIPTQITITTQPQPTTTEQGNLTKLFAKVSGPPPLTFQWQKDGVDLPEAIHRILTFPNPQSSDAGRYRLGISTDGLAAVTTEEVPLTVIPPVGPGPHRFTGIPALEDGTVRIGLEGTPPPGFHDIFAVDATDDFAAWTALFNLASANGGVTFRTDSATGHEQRFFRAASAGYWTPYPAPTGPHRVGTERRQLTDPTRAASRGPVVITIWYPAEPGPSAPPALWLEDALIPGLVENVNPGFSILSRVYSHAIPDLPAAETSEAWPVIIYSHGHYMIRSENTALMTELASHGYIAVAVDHIDAGVSLLDDGSVVGHRGGHDYPTLEHRIRDIRFLTDELEQWNMDDPLLAGKVDTAKVGAIGFSFGGEAALEVARLDSRCGAAVGLDTGFSGSINTSGFTKPALHFMSAPWSSLTDPIRNFYDRSPSPAYFAQVQGTVHGSFSSFRAAAVPELPIGVVDNLRMNRLLKTYTLSFFNKHLKGEDDGLLDGPSPEYPEANPFLTK